MNKEIINIGVVSDSHGNLEDLRKAVDALAAMGASVIFHLGDYVEDAMEIRHWVGIPLFSLQGNMDFGNEDGVPFVKTLLSGKTVIACHGHKFGVKGDLGRLYYKAREEKADIVLYGHTHVPRIDETGGILMMNPGALAYSRYSTGATYGMVTIGTDGKVSGEIYPVAPKNKKNKR